MRLSGQTLAQRFPPQHQAFLVFKQTAGHDCSHQLRAQRFFSACRSQWRKIKQPGYGVDQQKSAGAHGRGALLTDKAHQSASQYRINHIGSPKSALEPIIERLKVVANKNVGTELSSLAKKVISCFQAGKFRQNDEFGHIFVKFRQAYVDEGVAGLDSQIKYALHGCIANRKISEVSVEDQTNLADLRYPLEWYPATRALQRTIHLHVGPTNSGKTYHALKRLEQAKTGVYAGPLRLLAYEVYTRLNALGKKCHLITGDDRRVNEEADEDTESMISCTVEMVPINTTVDVGVIDEIQMIGHSERAWAWSQALLGLKAKELHLCGEARTVPLIRELAAAMGDKLVLHSYERLSPLKVATKSLNGDLKQLRKGDCLVVFSRKEIHSLKNQIERLTNKRVAIVYGSLPPETRARQASLFNDPDNDYDYLVASDAIGMGLNLDIKRIVFESTFKFDGKNYEPIHAPHLKQIAGRAGRYRVAPQVKTSLAPSESIDDNVGDGLTGPSNAIPSDRPSSTTVGLVTTLEKMDFPRIQRAMEAESEPVMSAGIFPPASVLIKFATYFAPETPFSYILQRLHELSSLHPRYHLCELKDKIDVADIIEPIRELTIEDRIIFCAAPASVRLQGFGDIVASFAQCVANSKDYSSNLLDIPTIQLEILDREVTTDRKYLSQLETLHQALILYIWLSYRFAGVFRTQAMAVHVKEMVEERIDKVLAQVSYQRKQKLKSLRQLAMLEEMGDTFGGEGEGKDMKAEPSDQIFGEGLYFGPNGVKVGREDKDNEEQSTAGSDESDFELNHLLELEASLGWQPSPQMVNREQEVAARNESAMAGSS